MDFVTKKWNLCALKLDQRARIELKLKSAIYILKIIINMNIML